MIVFRSKTRNYCSRWWLRRLERHLRTCGMWNRFEPDVYLIRFISTVYLVRVVLFLFQYSYLQFIVSGYLGIFKKIKGLRFTNLKNWDYTSDFYHNSTMYRKTKVICNDQNLYHILQKDFRKLLSFHNLFWFEGIPIRLNEVHYSVLDSNLILLFCKVW